jgi:hypothetical protein
MTQALPQLPQFCASFVRSTHAEPQVDVPAEHWQFEVKPTWTQSAPLGQALPHAPQLFASFATQVPPQVSCPALQPQFPPWQVDPAPQSLPHDPQFCGSF